MRVSKLCFRFLYQKALKLTETLPKKLNKEIGGIKQKNYLCLKFHIWKQI